MCNPRAPLLALATLLTSLLVLVGGPLAVSAAGQAGAVAVDAEGEPILDVILDGNVLVDHALIQANLRTRPGALYARRNVDEDIRWMHDTYGILVEDVPVRMVAGGAVVTFKLRRILQYEFVDFEGNDEFSDRVLRDEARIGAEGGATPDQLVHAKSLITDHYLNKGFPFVQVEVRPSSREDGTRGAVVRVFEGPETETQRVEILGLDGVDEGAVRELLRSERGFWAWLVGKDFVRADVDRDILILEDYVRREGFLDAEASLDGLEWSEDRTEVVIRFLVDQG